MEMTTWDYNQEKERAAADVSNKKHADLRDMVFDERHACHLLNQEFGKVKAELAALKAAHAWIKTSERMPVSRESVLGIDGYGEVAQVSYSVPYLWTYDNSDKRPAGAVTHWMPLPEAPK
jgi:hypothetical protein